MFNIAAACLVITAFFSYVNRRFVGLPTTIGVMAISLGLSTILLVLDSLGFGFLHSYETGLLHSIDFSKLLMEGMLSLLLFAGALHVDVSEMKRYRWHIVTLTVVGTTASTLIVAAGLWSLLPLAGIGLPFSYCFVFGALISPTDPIAVIGILKKAGAPKNLSIVIAGESLFNDGVAVVLFSLGVMTIETGETPRILDAVSTLAREAGGGILFGLCLGWLMYGLLKTLDSYQDEILITLAGVTGGYALATEMHLSGPLAMVVAGLIIGNHARESAMSSTTREHLDTFWDLIDSILNAVLFVLTGMAAILISFEHMALAAALAITVTLFARLMSAGVPSVIFRRQLRLPYSSWRVLTWGGLRGGISVALALSLPLGLGRDTVLALTYSVVVFSILVQGLTIGKVVKLSVCPNRNQP
jgi:CPA1 family monovalent cation:H+ antiporter